RSPGLETHRHRDTPQYDRGGWVGPVPAEPRGRAAGEGYARLHCADSRQVAIAKQGATRDTSSKGPLPLRETSKDEERESREPRADGGGLSDLVVHQANATAHDGAESDQEQPEYDDSVSEPLEAMGQLLVAETMPEVVRKRGRPNRIDEANRTEGDEDDRPAAEPDGDDARTRDERPRETLNRNDPGRAHIRTMRPRTLPNGLKVVGCHGPSNGDCRPGFPAHQVLGLHPVGRDFRLTGAGVRSH